MLYIINPPIGTVKHSISFWDGVKAHKDGSELWEIRIFDTAKEKQKFEDKLIIEGYENTRRKR